LTSKNSGKSVNCASLILAHYYQNLPWLQDPGIFSGLFHLSSVVHPCEIMIDKLPIMQYFGLVIGRRCGFGNCPCSWSSNGI